MNHLERVNQGLEYFLSIGKQGCMVLELGLDLGLNNRTAHNLVGKLQKSQLISIKSTSVRRGKALATSYKINTKGKQWLQRYKQYLKAEEKIKLLKAELKS